MLIGVEGTDTNNDVYTKPRQMITVQPCLFRGCSCMFPPLWAVESATWLPSLARDSALDHQVEYSSAE